MTGDMSPAPVTALDRSDARVHRCPGCGAWTYGRRPCTTCQIIANREENPAAC